MKLLLGRVGASDDFYAQGLYLRLVSEVSEVSERSFVVGDDKAFGQDILKRQCKN